MAQRKPKSAKVLDDQGYSALESYCIGLNEYYKALRKAGFAVDVALYLISDSDSYPDWILPKPLDHKELPYLDEDDD